MKAHGRRRIFFACSALTIGFVAAVAGLLAVDVYLHHRVQNLGGVNVWGYRGPVRAAKQPHERRLVVLGGSTAFGYGLPYNEAFPFYLEQKLNEQADNLHQYSVVNLGAPGQGAFGFQYDLADFAFLDYDVAILYEGYNDLGSRDLPEAVPPRDAVNTLLWRRQSPVFRLTGYFPVLPLVFHEKAMALRAGGDLDAAYRGRATFKPGLMARATAGALETAATIANHVGDQLGRLSSDTSAVERQPVDDRRWLPYVASVVRAVEYARLRGVKVLVVTQPYASDAHVSQQRALAEALTSRFESDPAVTYMNLGRLLNVRDRAIAYDGLHLVAAANRHVAEQLVAPALALLQ